jgi:SlyX protein
MSDDNTARTAALPDEGVTMNGDTQPDDSSMHPTEAPAWLARRLEALESRLAYQEHWLDTLDEAVAQQEKRLTQLERINALMQEKLRDQQRALQEGDAAPPRPEDEVPPHY